MLLIRVMCRNGQGLTAHGRPCLKYRHGSARVACGLMFTLCPKYSSDEGTAEQPWLELLLLEEGPLSELDTGGAEAVEGGSDEAAVVWEELDLEDALVTILRRLGSGCWASCDLVGVDLRR